MSDKIRMAALIVVAAVLVLGVAACGGGSISTQIPASEPEGTPAVATTQAEPTKQAKPRESAEDAMVRMFELAYSGQHGKRWDGLHPEQQAMVTRSRFVECSAALGASPAVEVKALESYAEPVELLGREVPSMAVVIEYSLATYGQKETLRTTAHAIQVGDTWRWITSPRAIAAFEAGSCP